MVDTILEAIQSGSITTENISYTRLRQVAGRNLDLWEQLGRGRAILTSADELDQYLYSYGPMTQSQWAEVLCNLSLTPEPTQIIDYGCGQGLATALMFDHFGSQLIETVKKVVLVEPSVPALKRAAAVVSCYAKNADVVSIAKKLNDLEPHELKHDGDLVANHLLSNVLDIDGFDHLALFTKMLQCKGRHSVLAVSHDRDFEGGSLRFRELDQALNKAEYRSWFTINHSAVSQFQWGNGQPAIAWHLEAEVLDGSI